MIEQIVEYNKKFVENKGYEPYLTSKYPNKKLAVLTCMDTRLTELLPAALGLKKRRCKDHQECRWSHYASIRKCGQKPSGCHSGAWGGAGYGHWTYGLRCAGNGWK